MNRTGTPSRLEEFLRRIKSIPGGLAAYWSGKLSGWLQSEKLAEEASALPIARDEIRRLRKSALHGQTAFSAPQALTPDEQSLVVSIREETERFNRNNLTRTAAYWNVFSRTPELHWAFLAHMVSRNGGWTMTDLKGGLLPRLLSGKRAEAIFALLERANGLIFQDAYPQLRLYEASVQRKQPLFHLLREFDVSAFMRPVWEQFWAERNSALLTVALIVNEQHYIEGRVVQDSYFRRTVLDTPAFQAQSLLQMNMIVFPYLAEGNSAVLSRPDTAYRLAGLVIEDFTDLRERIAFGKKLYAILFAVPGITRGARDFAAGKPYSGSRADYWPHLFAPVRRYAPAAVYTAKLEGGLLKPGAEPFYSPKLEYVWPDVPFQAVDRYDWHDSCKDAFVWFESPHPPASFEITNEYTFSLNKLELAVLAGELLFE
ncbi:DUF2515 family protein [Paenibacillus oceani]|uniref:DUF2515 family protein n=1 Tax=Paenibacillus oceani TaxID=2772510 RepID=A0A927CJ58_9BACL|nr:DUF2515 family protein [Paenibacillus oceani]MBD2866861.1 DUF2515 family protein [Paenibacillus oceani]